MQPGTQLGHYEIFEAIGKGGMGEVWRAKDTKLGREVALKVLPRDMARDADRLSRFEREAKTIAALNHPNIVTIFSLEHSGDVHFLATEPALKCGRMVPFPATESPQRVPPVRHAEVRP